MPWANKHQTTYSRCVLTLIIIWGRYIIMENIYIDTTTNVLYSSKMDILVIPRPLDIAIIPRNMYLRFKFIFLSMALIWQIGSLKNGPWIKKTAAWMGKCSMQYVRSQIAKWIMKVVVVDPFRCKLNLDNY